MFRLLEGMFECVDLVEYVGVGDGVVEAVDDELLVGDFLLEAVDECVFFIDLVCEGS